MVTLNDYTMNFKANQVNLLWRPILLRLQHNRLSNGQQLNFVAIDAMLEHHGR
jgi:hypothetical protein